ncbi:MAG: hypothetical protein COA78_17785 [Blastopirellula sp.]|nr:MAG: hypothetical protein COA78_17785 [Blastopirellula sp.]
MDFYPSYVAAGIGCCGLGDYDKPETPPYQINHIGSMSANEETLSISFSRYRRSFLFLLQKSNSIWSLQRVRKENRLLLEEREILKKATMFFAGQSK